MPKQSNKIDYTKTPISFYRFVCNDENITSCYVGHTANFTQRKSHHKSNCNNPNNKEHNKKLYVLMRENGGFNNWKMIEIISKLCLSKRDAERQEQVYIDELQADINAVRAYRTEEQKNAYMNQYNSDHKDYHKQYAEEHKQQRSEYIKKYNHKHKQIINDKQKQYRAKKREIAEHQKQLNELEQEAEYLHEQQRINEILNEDDDESE